LATAGGNEAVAVPRLYVQPTTRRFGQRDADELREYLSSSANTCLLRTVAHPDDLLLDATGQTAVGYRYSWSGFKAVTANLCDGLQTVLLDLTGERNRGDNPPCDFGTAVSVFNAAVRLRFSRFQSMQIVCTPGSRTIDGLVSETYQFVSNRRFLELMTEAIRTTPSQFLAAMVQGRRMMLWFRELSPAFTYYYGNRTYPHWLGFYGGNSEGTHTSMRFAPAVFSQFGTAVGSMVGRRQIHVGADLEPRLKTMFQQVIDDAPDAAYYADMEENLSRSLGVPTNENARASRIVSLARSLVRPGVPQAIAQEIVNTALSLGADQILDMQVHQETGYRYGERTAYDLVCGAMRCGVQIGIARRESVEQTAYAVLTGRTAIPGVDYGTEQSSHGVDAGQ